MVDGLTRNFLVLPKSCRDFSGKNYLFKIDQVLNQPIEIIELELEFVESFPWRKSRKRLGRSAAT
jgi:hypothetical protein